MTKPRTLKTKPARSGLIVLVPAWICSNETDKSADLDGGGFSLRLPKASGETAFVAGSH
jgi:hypothetical protein